MESYYLMTMTVPIPTEERINEVLSSLRDSIEDDKMKPFLQQIEEGLTYSDVLLMLKWYKVLPR